MGRRLLFIMMLFGAACSTDSCACNAWEARSFPADKIDLTIPAVGQARVTSSGLDYVESQVPFLLSQALPGGLSFCIPPDTSGNPDLCIDSTCANGSDGCQVDLTLDDQQINPAPPDTLEVEVTIGSVDERLNFDYDTAIGTVNCYLQTFKKGASEDTPAQVTGTIPVRLLIDPGSDYDEVGIDVGDVVLDLTDVDFKIHGRGNLGDTLACEGASLVRDLFRGRIEDEIRAELEAAVTSVRRSQLCRQCGSGSDCPNDATCTSGVCDYSPGQCVPRTLGIEGRLELGPALLEAARVPSAAMDLMAKGADLARVDSGATVGLRAGFDATELSDCAPIDPVGRPAVTPTQPSPTITGDTRPGGAPFMFGLGLHKSAIEQALWSVWSSGVGCLHVDDQEVMVLTTTTFALPAPSLKDFAQSADSAVLATVPNRRPTVELGANTIRAEGDSYAIEEGLLTIHWDDIDFHVFIYAQDRFLRLATLRVDLEIPVAVVPDGTGTLHIVVPELEGMIADIEPRRLELLSESAEMIRDAVPTLLAVAEPFIVFGIPETVELPEFLGFRIALNEGDITSVDDGEFIGIFADLERTNQPVGFVANTLIEDHAVSYENALPSGFVRPEVRLNVRGYANDPLVHDGEYEFSWRVDGGLWSLYRRSDELVVDDPALAVNGEHDIEVRARRIGEPATADPRPAKAVVEIEWTPEPIAEERIVPEEPPVSSPAPTTKPAREIEVDAPDRGMRLGCSAAAATGGGWLPLFVVLFFWVRRPAWVVLLLAGMLGGCGGCKGKLETNAPERCYGEACKVDKDCTVDSDCNGICPAGNGGICESGRCMCVKACDPGCDENSFCCTEQSECVAYAPDDVCAEHTCEAGYERGVSEAEPNRETCELEEVTCGCVPLPPIPVGWHGRHTSIDSDGELTVVATYNKEYGDLMVGSIAADGTVSWHWVDGVPDDGSIEGDPNGPRGGRTERGPDVGTHSAVAIGGDGVAHVFYRDVDDDVLKWGKADFGGAEPTFESDVVDDTPGAGKWAAAVASGEEIHVVYAVLEVDGNSEVRHIAVDAAAAPSAQDPAVVASEPVGDLGRNFPPVAGAFFDLTESDGTPFLVYWNGVTGRVGRTQWDGSSWAEPTFLAANTGPWAAGYLDAEGREHVTFQQRAAFRYSRFGQTTTSLVHDGVFDSVDEYWTGTAGENSSVRVDGDEVIVAYQDAFDRSLMIATSTDGSEWATERLVLPGTAGGLWIAQTRRGARFIADMVIDRTADPSAYVRVTPY